MSSRVQRALERAATDRRAQAAAGALAAAGAAAIAGKAGFDRARNGDGSESGGPSRAYRLRRGETVPAGVRRIAATRADDAIERLSGAGDGDPAAAVHEARKDLKKLRSLLRLVRDELGEDLYSRENDRYRDAGRLLSAARDAEVKLETLTALEERDDELPGEAVEGLRSRLEGEREDERPDRDAATAAIVGGREAIEDWSLEHDDWRAVEPGLRRSYKRGRKRMKRAARDPSAENVHDWRKRSKDLWYHLRLVRQAWPELLGDTADQAHELADLLGDHHDLAVLASAARSDAGLRAAPDEQARVLASIERRQTELFDGALSVGRRVYAEKPREFSARVGAYWEASELSPSAA
jgi:CHAD domain-containing protein